MKLTNLDVAHYSKKLEKIGFVTSNSSSTAEKVISLRKTDRVKAQAGKMGADWQSIFPEAPIVVMKQEETVQTHQTGRQSKRKRIESDMKAESSPNITPVKREFSVQDEKNSVE